MVAAAHAPVAVRRDERYAVGGRAGETVGDDLRRELGQPPEAALLPRGHDRWDRRLVCHGRARGGEREPPARALTAPPHGPRRRRAAALAVRAEQERKRGPASGQRSSPRRAQETQRRGSRRSSTTSPRRYSGNPRECAHGSAPEALLLERVFVSRREPGALAHQVVRDEELLRVADVHPVAGEAVAVHRLAGVEPDDEVARRVRAIAPLRGRPGSRRRASPSTRTTP